MGTELNTAPPPSRWAVARRAIGAARASARQGLPIFSAGRPSTSLGRFVWEFAYRSERLFGGAGDEPAAAPAPEHALPLDPWWEPNLWESNLQPVLMDYVRPGGVAFDVGANAGALSVFMARLVGPRGVVAAFEASPRIVPALHANLLRSGCGNIQVYDRAVSSRTGDSVPLYAGEHLNDSLYGDRTAQAFTVRTLALDDFAASTGLTPDVIKADIEGAEYDMLLGMSRLLREARPVLLLEQIVGDPRARTLLAGHGYVALDTATYRRIGQESDFPPGVQIANVLFVPSERAPGDRYLQPEPPAYHARIDRTAFDIGRDGSAVMRQPLALPQGRFVLSADFDAKGRDNEVTMLAEVDGERVARFHAPSWMVATSYRDMVLALDRPAEASIHLRLHKGADPSVDWRGVDVWRVPGFDDWRPPPAY